IVTRVSAASAFDAARNRVFNNALAGVALNRQLDLANRPRHLNAARASRGAVVDRPAAPDAIRLGQRIETLLRALVAAVENEAVRLNNRRRANIVPIGPEAGTGGGASGAENALGRIVKTVA